MSANGGDYGFSAKQETKIIFLLGAVQFINVLDFMMVMPMGPDFAISLGILPSHLGWIGGSYTAAAAISGMLSSFFLDRFDRKTALVYSLAGLAIATVIGGFAVSFNTLLLARILAGLFGGPVATLTFAMTADAVPVERRGRAMGALMSAFSIASVFGVPAGLELARIGGWKLPFFGVGGLAFLILGLSLVALPSMRAHIPRALKDHPWKATCSILSRGNVWLAYGNISVAMIAGFMLIPNLATYFQFNMGFPREKLGSLYLFGGLFSFSFMLISGRLIDRFNAVWVGSFSTLLLLLVTFFGFVLTPSPLPIYVIFVGFMSAMGIRGVASTALASRVPAAHERARFVSFMSVCQHAASAVGAFFSASALTVGVGGSLVGMSHVGKVSMAFSMLIMFFMVPLEIRLNRAK